MSNVTINVTKWYHFVLAIGSVIAMLSGTIVWVDSRYIHHDEFELAASKAELELTASKREGKAAARAAYNQSINLQYMIVQGRVETYAQMVLDGKQLTAQQTINQDDYLKQYAFLTSEKNRLMMGLGVPD